DPAEKPPLVPAWITHNSGTVTVPAGGSVVFGYAVVSDDMNVLKTWDMGAAKLGGNGTVRVEQYNATAGSAMTNTTAASYRRSLNMEDAEFVRTQGGLPNGTMIHFRLVETTGTDDVTAIGFVTFGWAAE